MNIGIFGMGYVGFATLASLILNNKGYSIYCFDSDTKKIHDYKIGVFNNVEQDIKNVLLKFKYNNFYLSDAVQQQEYDFDVIFVCVGTPTKEDGHTDLSSVYSIFDNISNCKSIKKSTEIIIKSTVPIGTCQSIKNKFHNISNLVFIPEFLREGTSLHDTLNPDRIIFGVHNKRIPEKTFDLYSGINCPYLTVSYEEAETIKYACNNFLAMKISFINMIRQLCDIYEINMDTISYAMGLDKRIGIKHLQSGIGFGGGCFPKDNNSLITQFEELNINAGLLKEIRKINANIPKVFCKKIEKIISDLKLQNKISVLRCVFKENTNDVRESQTIKLVHELLSKSFEVNVFEKTAYSETKKYFENIKDIAVYSNLSKVLESGNIIIITIKDENVLKDLGRFNLKDKILVTPYENIIDKEKHNFKKCIKL